HRQNLPSLKEVPKIGAREVLTGVAAAVLIYRPVVASVGGILDHDLPVGRKKQAISGTSRWEDAVEHVDARPDAGHKIQRRPDPHQIPRLLLWKKRSGVSDPLMHRSGFLPNGVSTQRVTREVDGADLFGVPLSEIV